MERVGAWYFMNLAHRSDRREATERQLRAVGCRGMTRIEAVRDITGGVGCLQSHIRAIQAGVDDGHEFFVVIEDDMEWKNPEEADEALAKAIATGEGRELLYLLGTNPVQEFRAEELDSDFLQVKYAIDAGASLFSRPAALKMLEALNKALEESRQLLRSKGLSNSCIFRLTPLAADRIRCKLFESLLTITDKQGRQPMHQPGGYSDLEFRVQDHVANRRKASSK